MANPEHLARLKEGVSTWNQWRKAQSELSLDLSGADLSGADLSGADLSGDEITLTRFTGDEIMRIGPSEAIPPDGDLSQVHLNRTKLCFANLAGANLRGADLSLANLQGATLIRAELAFAKLNWAELREANLREAQLSRADLDGANLRGADLSGTDLYYTKLSGTDLSLANLSGARLHGVDLHGADLHGTILTGAYLTWTIFADNDLRSVKGLDTLTHEGPSIVDVKSIQFPQGNLLHCFLRGTGFSDQFNDYLPSLLADKAIQYHPCFISYSSKDDVFAKRLYADLQNKGVRCWFAPEHLKWGTHIRTGIDEAIRHYEKLLLILSKNSLASGWVEREIITALKKERKEKQTVLFPIRLDNAILDCPFAWATEIRQERNIGNFTRWKDEQAYQKALTRLLRDLKAEEPSN